MRFDIITIFPNIFDSYLSESILARARTKGLIKIKTHDLRDYATDKRRTVDDAPYGGGAGMVLKAEPILKAVDRITGRAPARKKKIVVFSAKGKQFNQKMAYRWSQRYDRLILICGRYEGIDERATKALGAEEVSVGPYVLTDGDVPAMIVISAVSRLAPGVIALESLEEESHWNALVKEEKGAPADESLEYPHYTRPEVLEYKGKKYRVPEILLSGNHAEIAKWRKNQRILIHKRSTT